MYMMTYSELPVFMTCGNGNAWYQVDGPGGIPPATRLAPESSAAWRPPAPIGVAANDEPTMGQVSGELLSMYPETYTPIPYIHIPYNLYSIPYTLMMGSFLERTHALVRLPSRVYQDSGL